MQKTAGQKPQVIEKKEPLWLAVPLLLIALLLLGWVDANYIVPLKELNVANSGNDFGVFWSASRTLLEGHNPYDSFAGSRYRNIVIEAGGNLQPLEPFISPLYLTLFFAPLVTFSLGHAATIWLVIMQGSLAIGMALVIKVFFPTPTVKLLLAGLAMALLWRYTFLVMMIGNVSLIIFFTVASSYFSSRKNLPYLAGGLAAILLIKPQATFLIIPLLLVIPTGTGTSWLNRPTRQRLIGFGAVLLVFMTYSFSLLPGWIGHWLQSIAATGYGSDPVFNSQFTSLRSLVAVFVSDANLIPALSILLSVPLWLGLGWLWWLNRSNPDTFIYVLLIAIPLNILTTPYIRDYDSCLMLFTLLICFFGFRSYEAERLKGIWRWSWLCWLAAFLPYPVHILAAQSTYAYETLIPVLLIGLTLLLWRKSTFRQLTPQLD